MNKNIPKNTKDLDHLLKQWSTGDENCEEILIGLLYPEIHRIAHFQMKLSAASALQTTELVNEAYIKLSSQKSVNWKNKNHFLAIAAKVIRRVVIDHYRSEHSLRRGGAENFVTLNSAEGLMPGSENSQFDWLVLDDLITKLRAIDKSAADIVEYKIFGDMTLGEMAMTMSVSESTISRNWKFAKTWILQQWQTKNQ